MIGTAAEHDTEDTGKRSDTTGFWIVGAVFTLNTAACSAPAPLYVLYQRRDGFAPFTLTLIFAAYALGVVVSLFTVGHLSDGVGRRRTVTAAVLVNVLALLVFFMSPGVPALALARFVSGLGIGTLTATATAYLTELHAAARPSSGTRRAEMVATAANLGGLGLGPLVSGLLAQYAPAPLRTPYVVFFLLLLLAVGALPAGKVSETVERDPAWHYHLMRVAVPPAARARYTAAAMLAFCASAMFGLFSSLAPSFMATRLGIHAPSASGAVTFLVLASAAGFQILVGRLTPRRQALLGMALLGSGLVIITMGLTAVSLTALLAGGALAGAGAGTAYKAAIGSVIAITGPETRGEALAGLFLGGYVGMSVPVLGLGLLLLATGVSVAVLAFGALLAALLLATLLITLRSRDVSLCGIPACAATSTEHRRGRPAPRHWPAWPGAVSCAIPPGPRRSQARTHPNQRRRTPWPSPLPLPQPPATNRAPLRTAPPNPPSAPSNSVMCKSTASSSSPTRPQ